MSIQGPSSRQASTEREGCHGSVGDRQGSACPRRHPMDWRRRLCRDRAAAGDPQIQGTTGATGLFRLGRAAFCLAGYLVWPLSGITI